MISNAAVFSAQSHCGATEAARRIKERNARPRRSVSALTTYRAKFSRDVGQVDNPPALKLTTNRNAALAGVTGAGAGVLRRVIKDEPKQYATYHAEVINMPDMILPANACESSLEFSVVARRLCFHRGR